MKLLNPIILSCLAVVVLPVVLHFLHRSRYRDVRWGAMMFFDDEDVPPQSNPTRWRQRGLLAIRILLLAMIGFALARPTLTQVPSADSTRLAVVIVVDTTPSMGHVDGVDSRLSMARHAATSILSQLQRGDQAGLVVLGQTQNRDIPLTTDLQDIASRIASLTVSLESGDMNDGQRRAGVLVQQAERLPKKIYLIGDRDLLNWATLDKLDHDSTLTISAIPIGSTISDNISIDRLKIDDQPAMTGKDVTLQIELNNHSNIARDKHEVAILDGVSVIDRFTADLPAKSIVNLFRTLSLKQAGDHLLTVQIASAGIPGDDQKQIVASVMSPLKLQKIESGKIKSSDMESKNIFLLDNFSGLDEEAVSELEDAIFTGRGILIAIDRPESIDAFNRLFDNEGEGLAPSSISDMNGGIAHFRDVTIDNVFAKLPDGKPLMVYREYGKGRVICMAMPIRDPKFLQLVDHQEVMEQAIRYLSTADYRSHNLPLKSVIEVSVSNTKDRSAIVTRPDGRTTRVPLKNDNNLARAIYSNTNISGKYNVRIGATINEDFIVYGNEAESNLALLTDTQLRPIFKNADITQVDEDQIRLKAQLPVRQQELSLNFLIAGLALVGAEFFVSRRFSGEQF